ncbi:MAG: hypothetical protein OIN84_05270, partial [Candidatus Methanoperedens sp.]|nr:hypothetical protein [Candidatus Methanoperedens sp.]
MDVEEYIDALEPVNILSLIGKSVLINFLNGYSLAIGSRITVIIPEERSITPETLERVDALEPEFRKTFRSLCAYWRDPSGCNAEDCCIEADKHEAWSY